MNVYTLIGFGLIILGWAVTIGILTTTIKSNCERSKQNEKDIRNLGIETMKTNISNLQDKVILLNENHNSISETLHNVEKMLNQLIGKIDTYFKIFNKDGSSGISL